MLKISKILKKTAQSRPLILLTYWFYLYYKQTEALVVEALIGLRGADGFTKGVYAISCNSAHRCR